MENSTTGAVSFLFGCYVEGKERPTVESARWHDGSVALVMLQRDESVAPTITLVKEMGIIEEHDGCAWRALLVSLALSPPFVVAVGARAPPP